MKSETLSSERDAVFSHREGGQEVRIEGGGECTQEM